MPSVLATRSTDTVATVDGRQRRVRALIAELGESAWQRCSAGPGEVLGIPPGDDPEGVLVVPSAPTEPTLTEPRRRRGITPQRAGHVGQRERRREVAARFDVDPVEHEQLVVCRGVGHSVTPAGRLPGVSRLDRHRTVTRTG